MLHALDVLALPIVGALHCDRTVEGVVYRRTPEWTRPQIVDPALQLVVQMPAGVRLEFRTMSRVLELDALLTTIEPEGFRSTAAVFDVVVDGQLQSSVVADRSTRILVARDRSLTVKPGPPVTVRLELPGGDEVPVEVWLPHAAVLELRGARVDAGTVLHPLQRERRRWVHHGSSISHCADAPSPARTWPALVAQKANLDLINLAYAGQCVLDQHVARTIRDLDVDIISLKVGINILNGDLTRERVFVSSLHGFLDTIRERHDTTPLVVATPIVCPEAEDAPGPTVPGGDNRYHVLKRPPELAVGSLTLRRIRALITEVIDTRRGAGDINLHLVDGLKLFGPGDIGDLPDALHPNAAGYHRIAKRFHQMVFSNDRVIDL